MAEMNALLDQLTRLRAMELEYRATLAVLAIVTERLLAATQSEAVVISAAALGDSPDLEACREGSDVIVRVSR